MEKNQSWENELDNILQEIDRLPILRNRRRKLHDLIHKVEQSALQRGREEAVDYIRKEFNDERYAELWPENERDEDDTEGSAAEFWMFFNPILDEARSGITDVCEKHRAPDCMECFYTTSAKIPLK